MFRPDGQLLQTVVAMIVWGASENACLEEGRVCGAWGGTSTEVQSVSADKAKLSAWLWHISRSLYIMFISLLSHTKFSSSV
eukprot:SAG31_NODE_16_length_36206_cov_27.355728_43_plen_81_part_00